MTLSRQSAVLLTTLAACSSFATDALLAEEKEPQQQKPATAAAEAKRDGSQGDPLDRAIRTMRLVEQRIAEKNTGEETQKLQRQIVRDLDDLIKAARQQRGKSGSGSQSANQKQSPKQKQGRHQQQQGEKQAGQAGKSIGAPEKEGRQEKTGQQATQAGTGQNPSQSREEARETTQRSDPSQNSNPDFADRESLVEQVWGHLPPVVQQRMRNVYSENYLPEYQKLIRRYYEALAEQNDAETEP